MTASIDNTLKETAKALAADKNFSAELAFDRSAAHCCRNMARGPCKRALVKQSYAFGTAKLLFIETYGTAQGALTAADVTQVVKMELDCLDRFHQACIGPLPHAAGAAKLLSLFVEPMGPSIENKLTDTGEIR